MGAKRARRPRASTDPRRPPLCLTHLMVADARPLGPVAAAAGAASLLHAEEVEAKPRRGGGSDGGGGVPDVDVHRAAAARARVTGMAYGCRTCDARLVPDLVDSSGARTRVDSRASERKSGG